MSQAGLSAVTVPFTEESLILRQLKRQHSGFQGEMDQKDRNLCFSSSVHQDSVHFIQKVSPYCAQECLSEVVTTGLMAKDACCGAQPAWSWQAHSQQSVLQVGTANIQNKKTTAVGKTGSSMWITDVIGIRNQDHFSESLEGWNI